MPDNMTPHDDNPNNELSAEYGDVETLLRSLTVEDLDAPELPPTELWDAIEQELQEDFAALPSPDVPIPPAEVIDLAERRRSRWTMLSVAAALVIIVVGAAVIVDRDPGGDVVATANLTFDLAAYDPLGEGRSATADLVDDDGAYLIDLSEADLPAELDEDADLEIWLLAIEDGAVSDLVSLGIVDASDPGSFEIPSGYDPTIYRDVDISVEPRDGDRTHSGRTILRGPLARA